MVTERQLWPDVAIPPGETLAETLEALGISQADLAKRAGRPPQAISEIVSGKKEITPETAIEFERVLGIPAHIWIRLESDYRTVKARLADQQRLRAEVPLAANCPYKEMADLGWVAKTRDGTDRVANLLGFFGVASLRHISVDNVTWRKAEHLTPSRYALAAWLRRGEIGAREAKTAAFDEAVLTEMLPVFRSFTREQPAIFQHKLTATLASCGIAIVFVPHLKNTGAHGATRWASGKAIVQLSVRYRWADIFWFTLFHELCHVLRHSRQGVFINFIKDSKDEHEREADEFAAQHLIPQSAYQRFVQRPHFSASAVCCFADEVGVHPGVVVGRLQHDHKIPPQNLNGLREQYRLIDDETETEPMS